MMLLKFKTKISQTNNKGQKNSILFPYLWCSTATETKTCAI